MCRAVWRDNPLSAPPAVPGAAQEALQARRDEITCLVFAMIDAIRSGDTRLADALQQRAHRRVSGNSFERAFTRDEVAAFLAQRFPPHIAGQLAAMLLSPAAGE